MTHRDEDQKLRALRASRMYCLRHGDGRMPDFELSDEHWQHVDRILSVMKDIK